MAMQDKKDATDAVNLRRLRSFLTIADCESFSDAAERLFVSQSAVSRQISLLEEDLGVTLFIRTNRSVKLSPAGAVLYKEAKDLFARIDDIVEKVRSADVGMTGQLKIAYTGAERGVLPLVLKEFHNRYPDVQLDIRYSNDESLRRAILDGTVDLGFMLIFSDQLPEGISTQSFFEDRVCIVFSKDHPLAAKQELSPADLEREPLLSFFISDSSAEYEDTKNMCRRYGFTPQIIRNVKDLASLLMQVESGIGITLLMQNVASKIGGLKVVPIDNDGACVKLCLAWNSQNQNPCLSLFREMLKGLSVEELANLPA